VLLNDGVRDVYRVDPRRSLDPVRASEVDAFVNLCSKGVSEGEGTGSRGAENGNVMKMRLWRSRSRSCRACCRARCRARFGVSKRVDCRRRWQETLAPARDVSRFGRGLNEIVASMYSKKSTDEMKQDPEQTEQESAVVSSYCRIVGPKVQRRHLMLQTAVVLSWLV